MTDYPANPTPTADLSSLTDSILAEQKAADTVETQVEATPVETPVTPQEPDSQERERGYLRQDDYTRKTMAVADERRAVADEKRAWETQKQTELLQRQQEAEYYQRLQTAINDPDFLAQRSAAIRQQLNLPQPDQQPTGQQVQALLARQQQDLEARFEAKLQDTLTRHSIDQMKFDFGNQIQSHQQALLKEFPDLDLVPGVEKLITTEAMAQRPKDLAEAKSIMRNLAQERSAKLQKKIADSEQAAIMRHAKSQKTSIEPRGGMAPAVQSTPKNVRLGSRELEALIMNDLAAEIASKR